MYLKAAAASYMFTAETPLEGGTEGVLVPPKGGFRPPEFEDLEKRIGRE